jgi:hypothetical protein
LTRPKRLGHFLEIWAKAHPGEPLVCVIGGGPAAHGDHVIPAVLAEWDPLMTAFLDGAWNLRPLCGFHNTKRQHGLFTDDELRQWPCRAITITREEELRPIAEPLGFTLAPFSVPGYENVERPLLWQNAELRLMLYISARFTSLANPRQWMAKMVMQAAHEVAGATGWRILHIHAGGITRFRDLVRQSVEAFVRDPTANDFTALWPPQISESDDAWLQPRRDVGIVGFAVLRNHSDHKLWYEFANRLPVGPSMRLHETFSVWEKPRGRKCRKGERRMFTITFDNGAERGRLPES